MSMSLALADTYIATAMGGRNDTNMKARAREALAASMEHFQLKNDWQFLIVDTSQSFSVASCTIAANGTDVTASASALKNVLKGMTVTGTGVVANTTVASVVSAGAITLSAAATPGTVTLTFGGTIPIYEAVDQYTLPDTFWKPLSCRLLTNVKNRLPYITQRDIDAIIDDQTTEGQVVAYTIYNGASFDASGTQQTKIRFFRMPSGNDTALLRYYRPFNITADPVDIPDEYLYTLLNYASMRLIAKYNSNDERFPQLKFEAESDLMAAIAKDRNEGGEDEMERMKTPGELSYAYGDPFFPRGDYGAGRADGVW